VFCQWWRGGSSALPGVCACSYVKSSTVPVSMGRLRSAHGRRAQAKVAKATGEQKEIAVESC
jgi:hypothetical protein